MLEDGDDEELRQQREEAEQRKAEARAKFEAMENRLANKSSKDVPKCAVWRGVVNSMIALKHIYWDTVKAK